MADAEASTRSNFHSPNPGAERAFTSALEGLGSYQDFLDEVADAIVFTVGETKGPVTTIEVGGEDFPYATKENPISLMRLPLKDGPAVPVWFTPGGAMATFRIVGVEPKPLLAVESFRVFEFAKRRGASVTFNPEQPGAKTFTQAELGYAADLGRLKADEPRINPPGIGF